MTAPRIALLGFSIECNKWSPPATRVDFVQRTWLEGDAIVADAADGQTSTPSSEA